MQVILKCLFLLGCFILHGVHAEILTSDFSNEKSEVMLLTTFGYLQRGYFNMSISLTLAKSDYTNLGLLVGGAEYVPLYGEVAKSVINIVIEAYMGLRFEKSKSGGRVDYMDLYGKCPLSIVSDGSLSKSELEVSRCIILFPTKTSSSEIQIYQHKFSDLNFYANETSYKARTNTTATSELKKNVTEMREKNGFVQVASLPATLVEKDGKITLTTSMYFQIECEEQTGLYELYLHNCKKVKIITGKIDITERNAESYLSAGEMALPVLYAVMATAAFLTSFIWTVVLWNNRSKVFAIHYLMATFMFVKAISTSFHSIDYYYIDKDGRQEAWAVIFYIVHLLKGILLFICLLLIGTGWAFIKYVLTDREKKLFMIVIPLQVVANIGYMIRGEEQGMMTFNAITWTEVMFLIDILCFGIILISVVWSVRHLQDASATDGKAAVSLTKLKLFQHFYVMVICYLYFRRVLVYLLKITLPFRYSWMHHFFYESVSLIFFIITGYKFRPGCDNPYLSVPQYDEETPESQALTESGLTENLTKVNQYERDISSDDEGEQVVLLQRNKTSTL